MGLWSNFKIHDEILLPKLLSNQTHIVTNNIMNCNMALSQYRLWGLNFLFSSFKFHYPDSRPSNIKANKKKLKIKKQDIYHKKDKTTKSSSLKSKASLMTHKTKRWHAKHQPKQGPYKWHTRHKEKKWKTNGNKCHANDKGHKEKRLISSFQVSNLHVLYATSHIYVCDHYSSKSPIESINASHYC